MNTAEQLPIVCDAHAHTGSESEMALRMQLGIRTMLSCGNPREAAQAETLCSASPVFTLTAGVHPWYAADISLSGMLPYMERAALVGEIGLDSVWCTTPMQAQRRAFAAQLDWAAAHNKGVVLHTKGMEDEIARMTEGFPHPVIVHWYSGGMDALEHFLTQGCYLTIGPDIAVNPAVQAAAQLVPNDRILFETDGMEAVRWAVGDVPDAALPHVLYDSVCQAAKLRSQSPQTLLEYANGNFLRLI